jgi:phosphoribosylanthranilate isomerase
MHRTRIKICGVTRVEDALASARAGADAIGLVFHPSAPRFVPLDRVKEILAALPPFVTPVGVFVNTDSREILDLAYQLRLRMVQLNGNEPADMIAELRGLSVIKAVRVSPATFADELSKWREQIELLDLHNLRGIVLETAGTRQPGGSGVANDWSAIRQRQDEGDFDGLPPMIAAGGLTPATVASVVRDLDPWAVDVSSGVESRIGMKSREKIEDFVAAVRSVEQD